MQSLNNTLALIRAKIELNPWDQNNSHEVYLEEMLKEIKEAQEEMKKDNHIFLEDELWDILWDYFGMLVKLEETGYIQKVEHVFEKMFSKYSQRLPHILNNDTTPQEKNTAVWNTVKEKQKKENQQLHDNFYKSWKQ